MPNLIAFLRSRRDADWLRLVLPTIEARTRLC
jgi:hypothetical protein